MTAADVDPLDALLAHAEAADGGEFTDAATMIYFGFAPNVAAFIAACDPDTIRALVQRVKDAEAERDREETLASNWSEDALVLERERDAARADRDRLVTALAALADTADQQATTDLGNLHDSDRVVPLGLVSTRKIRDLIHDHGGTT